MRLNLFLFLTALLVTSCIKDSETFVPNKTLGNVDLLLQKINYNDKSATINASIDNLIITEKNEVIFIPAHSIVDENGVTLSGNVEMKYSIYTNRAADLIKNRELTSDIGKIVGWINVDLKFQQEGKKVSLKSDAGANIKVPFSNSDDNVQLGVFKWNNKQWSSNRNESSVIASNWKLETQSGTVFGTGYSITIKSDGEFLVGAPYINKGNSSVCVNLPENHSAQNTVVYIIFRDLKTSYKMQESANGFCVSDLPDQMVGQIVVLSEQNGKYFIGDLLSRTGSEKNVTMVTKEMSLEKIEEFLAAL